jgi:monofunctional biosynthetic peptidoglycan transglycosylase
MRNQQPRPLFDFSTTAEEDDWQSTDDVVMGGVSSSTLQIQPEGIAVFEGDLSLERGGGFASVHTELPQADLSAYDGLEMRVRGDGRRYRVRLRAAPESASVTYHAAFETDPGVWKSIRLPFASFKARFRGRWVPDAPPLDLERITSFGWLVADKQAGHFRLEVDWVRAYAEDGP